MAKFYNIEPELEYDEDGAEDYLNDQINLYLKEHPAVLHGDVLYVQPRPTDPYAMEYRPEYGFVIVNRHTNTFRYTESVYCAIGEGAATLIGCLSEEMPGVDYSLIAADIELFIKEELGCIL